MEILNSKQKHNQWEEEKMEVWNYGSCVKKLFSLILISPIELYGGFYCFYDRIYCNGDSLIKNRPYRTPFVCVLTPCTTVQLCSVAVPTLRCGVRSTPSDVANTNRPPGIRSVRGVRSEG